MKYFYLFFFISFSFFFIPLYGQDKKLEKQIFDLDKTASEFYHAGNYKEALDVSHITLKLLRDNSISGGNTYGLIVSHHANYLAGIGEFEDAVCYGLEALNVRKDLLMENETDTLFLNNYAMSLYNLATYYSCLHNYQEAIDYATTAGNMWYNIIMEGYDNSLSSRRLFVSSLEILSECYGSTHRFKEAITGAQEAIKLNKFFFGEDSSEYANSLSLVALLYAKIGDYDNALSSEYQALEIRKKTLGEMHPKVSVSFGHIGAYYYYLGDYKNAIKAVRKGLFIDKETLGTEHPYYASKLDNLALYSYYMYSLYDAIEYEQEALKIRESLNPNNYDYAVSLSNMAMFQAELGYFEEAIELDQKSLEITQSVFGHNSPEFATTLSNIANYYCQKGNVNTAIDKGKEALEIRKMYMGTNRYDLAISYRNLANYYRIGNNYKEALHNDSLSISFIEDKGSYDYALVLWKLALDYYNLMFYDKASFFFRESVNTFFDYTQNYFGFLSPIERERMWEKISSVFQEDLPFLAYKLDSEDIGSIYNLSALFSKGFLLNSEINKRKAIWENGDTIVNDLINRYNVAVTLFGDDSYIKTSSIRDSLKNVIYNLEDSLIIKCPQYADCIKGFCCNWKDVRNNLKDNELAVEFIYYSIKDNSRLYFALTLKNDDDNPKMIYLFNENDLIESINNKDSIIQQVWGPIIKKIDNDNVNTIYFSPCGILHNIPIEYLLIDNNDEHSEYDLYRISSTRELIKRKQIPVNNAIIYGGLDYTYPFSLNNNLDDKKDLTDESSILFRGLSDSLSIRGNFEPLFGTNCEAIAIDSILCNNDISTTLYMDKNGTEESFKLLSGANVNLIHLSTHGMFIEENLSTTKKEIDNLNFIRTNNDDRITRENVSLTRSFLVMSRGNMLVNHIAIPDGMDDGILTAQEISEMNLSNVDVVVLSACQTALGDITSEGVFGLQRGFKKAGANTILMSLDKVDDEATRILMVDFYKNLMEGKTKYQSLKEAQKHLRSVENGKYDDPKYWASFIMLDGLN